MIFDREEYERACEMIRKENQTLLMEFNAWMEARKLSERTAGMHFSNAAFFIQHFLLYEQPLRPHEGVSSIGMYLGYWFIRKGPIATPGTVKTNATSLVKFYSFLVEKGQVTTEQLDRMRNTIRSEMSHWQERARRYNEPGITNPSQIWI
jgi:FtsZ-binding cell division protein ZapB